MIVPPRAVWHAWRSPALDSVPASACKAAALALRRDLSVSGADLRIAATPAPGRPPHRAVRWWRGAAVVATKQQTARHRFARCRAARSVVLGRGARWLSGRRNGGGGGRTNDAGQALANRSGSHALAARGCQVVTDIVLVDRDSNALPMTGWPCGRPPAAFHCVMAVGPSQRPYHWWRPRARVDRSPRHSTARCAGRSRRHWFVPVSAHGAMRRNRRRRRCQPLPRQRQRPEHCWTASAFPRPDLLPRLQSAPPMPAVPGYSFWLKRTTPLPCNVQPGCWKATGWWCTVRPRAGSAAACLIACRVEAAMKATAGKLNMDLAPGTVRRIVWVALTMHCHRCRAMAAARCRSSSRRLPTMPPCGCVWQTSHRPTAAVPLASVSADLPFA